MGGGGGGGPARMPERGVSGPYIEEAAAVDARDAVDARGLTPEKFAERYGCCSGLARAGYADPVGPVEVFCPWAAVLALLSLIHPSRVLTLSCRRWRVPALYRAVPSFVLSDRFNPDGRREVVMARKSLQRRRTWPEAADAWVAG